MALHDNSDGCPPGTCHCGCTANPCKPCPTYETPTTPTPASPAPQWAWCIARPGDRSVCWPWAPTIPPEALAWAFEHQTVNPIPMAVSDPSAVEWPQP